MHLTDRLNLPQRIVIVAALALVFGEAGNYLITDPWTTARFGWSLTRH